MNQYQYQNAILPFSSMLKVSVNHSDIDGNAFWDYNSDRKICRFCSFYREDYAVCRDTLVSSARIAAQLGEPYIFLCPSGLVKIMVALIFNGKIQSYISAGPIAMGNNKENIIRGLIRKIEPKSESLPELALFLNEMCIFNPREVGHLASLLNSVVMSSINSPEDYRKINEHYKEQMDFGEQIQKYKRKRIPMDYPHELENELIQRVQNRDSEGIQEMMLELLKEISLYVSGDLSAIKVRALGICAVLARVSKGQQGSFEISSDEIEVMDLLNKAKTFKDICTYSSLICENFFDRMLEPEYKGDSQIVLSACKYIHENYMDRITLRTVAGELYTNASYLSSLFKKETGVSFTGYLNDVRMKQARDLLLHTNLSLLEISMRAGFDCQSYFSKVFKRTYDVTPREYRRKSVEGEI